MQELFVCVSNDRYELPLAVCENYKELSAYTGIKIKSLRSYICRKRNGYGYKSSNKPYKIELVKVED